MAFTVMLAVIASSVASAEEDDLTKINPAEDDDGDGGSQDDAKRYDDYKLVKMKPEEGQDRKALADYLETSKSKDREKLLFFGHTELQVSVKGDSFYVAENCSSLPPYWSLVCKGGAYHKSFL